MHYVAMMFTVAALSLGMSGKFDSAYEAASRGEFGTAAVELASSVHRAFEEQDTTKQERLAYERSWR